MFLRYVWSFIFPGFGTMCITVFEDNEGGEEPGTKPSVHVEFEAHRRATPFLTGTYF